MPPPSVPEVLAGDEARTHTHTEQDFEPLHSFKLSKFSLSSFHFMSFLYIYIYIYFQQCFLHGTAVSGNRRCSPFHQQPPRHLLQPPALAFFIVRHL